MCHQILSYLLWYLTVVSVGCSVRSYVCADLLSTCEGSPSKGGCICTPLTPPWIRHWSTSNLSEIMKNVHVFLIKTANSLMSSHPGLPTDNVWWIDSNSYSQEGMFSKQEWSTDAYISLFVTIHYTLFDLLAIRYSSWKAS